MLFRSRIPNFIAKLRLLSDSWAHKAGLYSISVSLTFFITVYHCNTSRLVPNRTPLALLTPSDILLLTVRVYRDGSAKEPIDVFYKATQD